ncbi:class I SAM-dependent methyltransferase [Rhodospirillaceae bacterium SYSU D60014]|uniref:class I SAM-dependent methyltransferase n=1 Tax=Virgifigura deserti TaxID=2268457 RepID=UPI000E66A55F
MSDWTAGYVGDVEYMAGFYPEQSPIHLNLACLLNGIEGVPLENGFSYCELGCGQGFTSMLLAAANPKGRFHAIDFNPAHIARARALADEAGLSNIQFLERSFAELVEETPSILPEFDFVTLHGVYSWISAENRQAIIAFLRRHLKPGGIVYVSYNCMPGWTAALPIQRLLYEHAALTSDGSHSRITRAIAFAEALQAREANHLRDNPYLTRIGQMLKTGQIAYLAHEYLNEHWCPLYHVDVARDLAAAKLGFVGSASLLENFPDLMLTPDQRDLLSQIGDPDLYETMKDYCVNRAFRSDVFLRGARRLPPARRDERLRRTRLALTIPRRDARLTLGMPRGEATLESRVYGPILDALAEQPMTVGELLDLPELKGRTKITPREVVGILVGSAQAAPVVETVSADAEDAVRRFNRVVSRDAQHAESNNKVAFAVASLGSGLLASVAELVAYFGLTSGVDTTAEDLAPLLWAPIAARGETLLKDGASVESEAENLALIREAIQSILEHKVPLWQQFRLI